MKFSAVLALFSLALPTLALPASQSQPLLPAPMSRRTVELWEKWTGDNACSILETVLGCKDNGEDCDEFCECQIWEGCGHSATYWCHQKKGYLDDQCDCHEPSGMADAPARKRSTALVCPTGQSSCLTNPGFSTQTECLDLSSTLDSCGGCTSEGHGTDCTQISGVQDVSCEYGACKVYSCDKGLKVENGTACVPDEEYKGIKNFLTGGYSGAKRVWA